MRKTYVKARFGAPFWVPCKARWIWYERLDFSKIGFNGFRQKISRPQAADNFVDHWVYYDVVALYPSIPIEKSIEVMSDFLNTNMDEIKARTKLSFHDLREMIKLVLKKCYFL